MSVVDVLGVGAWCALSCMPPLFPPPPPAPPPAPPPMAGSSDGEKEVPLKELATCGGTATLVECNPGKVSRPHPRPDDPKPLSWIRLDGLE